MQPTAEQTLIIEAARDTDENLLVNARAGAAKTTTIEMIAEAMPETEMLAIAFNKKIADELSVRLPDNCQAATLNALGHRAWQSFLGKWPKVDSRKTYFLLKEVLGELPPEDREAVSEDFRDLLQLFRLAKSEGYLPQGIHPHARPLIGDDSFFDLGDIQTSELHRQIINTCVRRSFDAAMRGHIDFDDQIYMPALMSVSFPSPPLTLIDEAQDLSPINHVLLRKIVKRKRLIAVGDPCQAIYGFRGASENSMEELRQSFSMRELYLTICFRSSQSIIRNARWRAPDMQWREGAPEGLVQRLNEWSPEHIRDGDAIICRNNAPLFGMAIALLRSGLHPELSSGDILKGILTAMRGLGPTKRPRSEALLALEAWHQEQKAKRKDHGRLADLASCIRVFLEETETLGQAIAFFEDITQRAGRIKLMTGHKSKGLEFDRVFFLDKHLLRKDRDQDPNIRYVIETRARHELYYVDSSGWTGQPA